MMTRLTAKPIPVLTRKQVRKAQMDTLRDTAFSEAIEASTKNPSPGKTAWVYMNTPLGGKASFFVRVSNLPDVSYGFPTSTLKLVAAFQKGKKTLG